LGGTWSRTRGEGGIVTRHRILPAGEGERHELERAVPPHRQGCGPPLHLVAADRGFQGPGQDSPFQQAGVKAVAVPWKGKAACERWALDHSQAWGGPYRGLAGIEGRIHRLRRDFGLKRCRDHGEGGMERDVGWSLLASALRQSGQACAKRAA
jgi:IS5 family transposase